MAVVAFSTTTSVETASQDSTPAFGAVELIELCLYQSNLQICYALHMSPLQVNVKLHERRNEALKWELLRQGGCQETFDSIAKEVGGEECLVMSASSSAYNAKQPCKT